MTHDRDRYRDPEREHDGELLGLSEEERIPRPRLSAGKRTLTSRLDAGPILRTAAPASSWRGGTTHGEAAGSASALIGRALASTGHSLPATISRQFHETTGEDPSAVTIHTGPESHAAAEAIEARAFALGSQIHMRAGEYDPGSESGQRLLAHEFAHTVQQCGALERPQGKLDVSQPGDALEAEADRAADGMLAGSRVSLSRGAVPSVARTPVARADDGVRRDAEQEAHDYFDRHYSRIFPALLPPLHTFIVRDGAAFITWRTDAGQAIGTRVWTSLGEAEDTWAMLKGFVDSPIAAAINAARGADVSGAGHMGYTASVTEEIASHLRVAMRNAVTRLLLSYLRERERVITEAENSGERPPEASAREPVAAALQLRRAIDLPVATALCSGIIGLDVAAFRAAYPGECAPAGYSAGPPWAPAPGGGVLRAVDFAFERGQGGWRWIRVVNPADATPQEVAHELYGNPSRVDLLVTAHPLYGITVGAGQPLRDIHQHAWQLHAMYDDTVAAPVDPALTAGPLGDEAAANQAGSQRVDAAPDQALVALRRASAALPEMFGEAARMQLFAEAQLIKEAHARLDERIARATSYACTPAESGDGPLSCGYGATEAQRLAQAPRQAAIIERAAAGLSWTATEHDRLQKMMNPDAEVIEAVVRVGRAFALVVAVADLVQTGRARLAEAEQLQAELPAHLMTIALARSRQALAALEGGSDGRTRTSQHMMNMTEMAGFNERLAHAKAREARLREEVAQLREAMGNDPTRVLELVDELPVKIDALMFELDLAKRVDAWDQLYRIVQDNDELFPEPPRPGQWQSIGAMVKEDGAPFATLWKQWLGYRTTQENTNACRAQLDALNATGRFEQVAKDVIDSLKREETRQKVRELAKTVAAFAVAWYVGAAAPAAAGGAAGGVSASSAARFLLTGPRAISGGISAGANLAGQAVTHGGDFSKYDWGAVGYDYVFGAAAQGFAKAVDDRWKFIKKLPGGKRQYNWTNLGRQQTTLLLYGVLTGMVRGALTDGSIGGNTMASLAEGIFSFARWAAVQQLFASELGALFPAGRNDPKFIVIDKSLSLIGKMVIRDSLGLFDAKGPETDADRAAELAEPTPDLGTLAIPESPGAEVSGE